MHLIDISSQALEQSERTLGRLRHISVVGHRDDLRSRPARRGRGARRRPARCWSCCSAPTSATSTRRRRDEFLRAIRGALAPGDALLLGADLVKPERDLQLAYDDPLGVTAAFNRNLLVRINRELGGDFDLDALRARRGLERRAQQRVEMHLESRARSARARSRGR